MPHSLSRSERQKGYTADQEDQGLAVREKMHRHSQGGVLEVLEVTLKRA
jgi:hypothetical protein